MAVIKPSRERYDPEQDLKVTGQFWSTCRRIEQGIPSKKYRGKTLIAVEFEIADARHPEQAGKRVAFVVPESIYTDPDDGSETILMGYARAMGFNDFTKQFDPEKEFLGKRYYVTCELIDGKISVRHAQVATKQQPKPTSPPPPLVTHEPIDDGFPPRQ